MYFVLRNRAGVVPNGHRTIYHGYFLSRTNGVNYGGSIFEERIVDRGNQTLDLGVVLRRASPVEVEIICLEDSVFRENLESIMETR